MNTGNQFQIGFHFLALLCAFGVPSRRSCMIESWCNLLSNVSEGIWGGPTDTPASPADTNLYSVCIMLIPGQTIPHVKLEKINREDQLWWKPFVAVEQTITIDTILGNNERCFHTSKFSICCRCCAPKKGLPVVIVLAFFLVQVSQFHPEGLCFHGAYSSKCSQDEQRGIRRFYCLFQPTEHGTYLKQTAQEAAFAAAWSYLQVKSCHNIMTMMFFMLKTGNFDDW